MPDTINDVAVAVRDVEEAIDFYEDLELPVGRYPEGGGDASLKEERPYVYVFETDGETDERRDDDLFTNPPGIDHLTWEVEDVDAFHDRITDRGISVLKGPYTNEGAGFRYIVVRDPSGNLFYFLTHV